MLDEPAGGLTHAEVDELAQLIRRLRDEFELTMLLVEHHMAMVMGISDKVVSNTWFYVYASATTYCWRGAKPGRDDRAAHRRGGPSVSAGRRPTRVNCARLAVLSVICLLGGGIAAGPARAESTVLTEIRRFDVPASTSQIVVAHADDFATSYATVETFERVDGTWRRAFDPMAARFGATGSVPGEQRVQGSHQTPAGIYTIPSGFGQLGFTGRCAAVAGRGRRRLLGL